MMKKILAMMMTAVLFAGVLTGCGSSTDAKTEAGKEEVTIRLGMLAGHYLPVVAENHGFFNDRGVKVELVTFDTGAAEVEAFTSGDLDVIQTGDLPILNGISNGVDLKIVGSYNVSDQINGLVVRDEANIKSFADLKGHKVSVPFGTNIQPLLYDYLELGGLTQEDVEIVNLNNADSSNALLTGDVDAAVLWDPFLENCKAQEGLTMLADTKELRKFVCPISAATSFIEQHPEELKNLLSALNDASKYSDEHIQDAADETAAYYEMDNAEAIKLSIEKVDSSVPLTEDKVAALLAGAQSCFKYDIVENEVNLEDYISKDFMNLD